MVQSKPAAYQIPRENYFFGKRLRFSGGQQDAPFRLFPRGSGKWVQPVHEYFSTDLPVLRLKSHLEHHSTRDLAHYLEKMRCYIPLEVETMKKLKRKVFFWDPYLRSVAKFVYLYFFKLGFLDGITGVQFAALSAYYDFKKWSLYFSWSKLNSRA